MKNKKTEVLVGPFHVEPSDINDTEYVVKTEDGMEFATAVNEAAAARVVRLLNAKPLELQNPRFVWIIGSAHEQYKDIPESVVDGSVRLWDRQMQCEVLTLSATHAQAFCLEVTDRGPSHYPFTNLADWLNSLTGAELASEGIPATHKEYLK